MTTQNVINHCFFAPNPKKAYGVRGKTFLLANYFISITSMGYAAFLVTGLKVREGRRAANTSL